MKKTPKRAVHFDFHTMPGIENFGQNFDAESFAKQLSASHIDHINVFARCNIGFSYYETKVGVPYPHENFRRLYETARECRKRGIGVAAYFHVGLNHELLRIHPEWRRCDKSGRSIIPEAGPHYFRTPCYNTGYADHLISEISELDLSEFDGVFCDGMTEAPCYCEKCLSDMRSQGIDTEDASAVLRFANGIRFALAKRIRAIVPKEKHLSIKGLPYGILAQLSCNIETASPKGDTAHFIANARMAASLGNALVLIPRFSDWGDFGSYRGADAIRCEVENALLLGASPFIGEHLHPVGMPSRGVFSDIAGIYGSLMALDGDISEREYEKEALIISGDFPSDSVIGAAKLLSDIGIQFDICDGRSASLVGYSLLILPDEGEISPELSDRISAFIAGGGKIVSSASFGVEARGFSHPAWDFEFFGKDTGERAYFELPECKSIPNMPYNATPCGILMKGRESSAYSVGRISPIFDKLYCEDHVYVYNPPSESSPYSVALLNGERSVAHIAYRIFAAYRMDGAASERELLLTMLKELGFQPKLKKLGMPSGAMAALYKKEGGSALLMIKADPDLGRELYLPLASVLLREEFKSAEFLPTREKIELSPENGGTRVKLPEHFSFLVIELKK